VSQKSFVDPELLARLTRLNFEAKSLMHGPFSGRHKSPNKGSSIEFSEYRKYVPGDDVRKIDWRIFARSDRFYVKEFEAETNLRCYIVFDCSASMSFEGSDGSKFDFGRKIAASIAHVMTEQGDTVGLTAFNTDTFKQVPPRSSGKHLRSIYEILDIIKPDGKTAIGKVLHDLAGAIQKRALVVIISDFFHDVEPMLKAFQHLVHRKHDVCLFHLIDEEEVKFDFNQPYSFIDLEGGDTMLADPATIKNQYLAAISSYLRTFKERCLKMNIDYRLAMLNEGCEDLLAKFLVERLEGRK
jgi:uncharacterized protein (DUF58 family)